ncbi:MAG: acyl-CoA dehydrogenase family protein [Deltaproteobacteria bacterium]|jgi:alkylation response protein AidB-like acyl-CoA dehydrogenase|nr:acyl-CoA dehydrogenase family protein [Deltaproteobacteria bacterium]
MVIDTVRSLKKKLLSKESILSFDRDEVFPEETIRQMLGPDIGLQLIFIPEAYGGMGGGARDCCEVTREMARICLGVGTAFFAIQLGADPIIVGGTEAQKEKWLGTIAEGTSLVAYAVTEAGAGSNLAALKTRAEPVSDDDGRITGYRINGTKQFISTGGYADFITLLAKTPEGPSFFIVEKGTQGFDQGKGEEKHGIRASNTSPSSFKDVLVPLENLVGGVPGKGLKQANKVFGYTRLMVASMALGAAQAAMDIVIQYAKERIQFGSPLSEKQGYTHKLVVPHVVRLEAAAAYIEEMALEVDRDGGKDIQVEGSIAKLFTTESANMAADDAMQALGGYGYISEFEVEKIKRDVKITCIYEGTSEIQQNIISTYRWKKSRKTKGEFYHRLGSEMAALETSFQNGGAALLGRCAWLLKDIINQAHDNRLTRQQYVMFGLADVMAHVEVGASLVRKAACLTEDGHPDAEKFRAISRIFANEVAQLTAKNVPLILMGTGVFSPEEMTAYLQDLDYSSLMLGYEKIIAEMDTVADILFQRAS